MRVRAYKQVAELKDQAARDAKETRGLLLAVLNAVKDRPNISTVAEAVAAAAVDPLASGPLAGLAAGEARAADASGGGRRSNSTVVSTFLPDEGGDGGGCGERDEAIDIARRSW